MQTIDQILQNLEHPAPREYSFSPRGGEVAPTGPVLTDVAQKVQDTGDIITVRMRNILTQSNEVILVNAADGYELPEGARFVD